MPGTPGTAGPFIKVTRTCYDDDRSPTTHTPSRARLRRVRISAWPERLHTFAHAFISGRNDKNTYTNTHMEYTTVICGTCAQASSVLRRSPAHSENAPTTFIACVMRAMTAQECDAAHKTQAPRQHARKGDGYAVAVFSADDFCRRNVLCVSLCGVCRLRVARANDVCGSLIGSLSRCGLAGNTTSYIHIHASFVSFPPFIAHRFLDGQAPARRRRPQQTGERA